MNSTSLALPTEVQKKTAPGGAPPGLPKSSIFLVRRLLDQADRGDRDGDVAALGHDAGDLRRLAFLGEALELRPERLQDGRLLGLLGLLRGLVVRAALGRRADSQDVRLARGGRQDDLL